MLMIQICFKKLYWDKIVTENTEAFFFCVCGWLCTEHILNILNFILIDVTSIVLIVMTFLFKNWKVKYDNFWIYPKIEHLNLTDIIFNLKTILRYVMGCRLNAIKIITFNLVKIKIHYKN